MTLKNRMYFVKNIAEDQQIDYLVLGAWGAGAFGFSSKEVAKMWHDVFSHPSSIKEVWGHIKLLPNGRHVGKTP